MFLGEVTAGQDTEHLHNHDIILQHAIYRWLQPPILANALRADARQAALLAGQRARRQGALGHHSQVTVRSLGLVGYLTLLVINRFSFGDNLSFPDLGDRHTGTANLE